MILIPLGRNYFDFTVYEPYGVSAQIVPWNYPMEMTARSLPAVLAAGNACVVKTPELDPLTNAYFAKAAEAVDLPRSALNILCGVGQVAGAGFLAVCALAAMESTASGYMATTGGILARDVFKCFLMPNAEDHVQKFVGRMCTLVIVVLALGVATTATDALVLIGNLAISYGFQMCPALIAACFWPFLTRQGVAAGLLVGLTAVTLTEAIGPKWLGIEAWGRWPLTIHSGGWGIFCNLSIAVLVSLVTRDDQKRKEEFHGLLREHAALPPKKRWLIPLAWAVPLLWFGLGLGPGVVIGNTVFGDPSNPESWWLGMPSLWTWALLWWALGVGMMWFLAYYMEMGTAIKTEITPLASERKVRPHIRLKLSAWRSTRLR